MREAAANAMRRPEAWIVMVYNLLGGLMAAGVIPTAGKWATAATVANVVLINVLGLMGRQVVALRGKTRASDLAETVEDLPPPIPPAAKKPRKKVRP